MSILLVFHLFLIASNRTTLGERSVPFLAVFSHGLLSAAGAEGFRSVRFVRSGYRDWRHPSLRANFEEVFGPLSYHWLLPTGRGSQGNGWDFRAFPEGISRL